MLRTPIVAVAVLNYQEKRGSVLTAISSLDTDLSNQEDLILNCTQIKENR